MKIKVFNIHKGERTFSATTRQSNQFAFFNSHDRCFAVTTSNFYWDTKADKLRSKSIQGARSSHDNADLWAEVKGEWCKVRIFSTHKNATLAECVDICEEVFKENLPVLSKRLKEIEEKA